MEEVQPKPTPSPRSGQAKRPVPLPRTCTTSSADADTQSQTGHEGQGTIEDVLTKGYNTVTKSLRNKIKSASGNVQGKGKAVIEGTKSVRSLLKRQSASQAAPAVVEDDRRKHDRCQSLPTEDVFSSIKFDSPIRRDGDEEEPESDDGLPPPAYPPPPPPDESIYDELSSHSGSHGDFYTCPSLGSSLADCETAYEDLPALRGLSLCDSSSTLRLDEDAKRVRVSRCESWSFYDTVHISDKSEADSLVKKPTEGENYENVIVCDSVSSQYENFLPGSIVVAAADKDMKKTAALKPLQPVKVGEGGSNLVRQGSMASSAGSDAGSARSVPNELYINWRPPQPHAVIVSEFDPLYEKEADSESLLGYLSSRFELPVPEPPARYDSITSETSDTPDIPNDVEYFLYQRPSGLPPPVAAISPLALLNDERRSPDRGEAVEGGGGGGKRVRRWASMKRAIQRVTGSSREDKAAPAPVPPVSTMVEPPQVQTASGPLHSGSVWKSASGGEKAKDFAQRWCQLAEGKLTFAAEKGAAAKETLLVEHIYSVQVVRETKQSADLYCLEVSCSSVRDRPLLLGCAASTERRVWMQRLLESLTTAFPPLLSADYTRAGWVFVKEGISGEWTAAWLLLHDRTLHYRTSRAGAATSSSSSEVDLRKVRAIVLQSGEGEGGGCVRVAEPGGPQLRLDCVAQEAALYVQPSEARETREWARVLRRAALHNGPLLHQQQLTRDDLPVIVDKCVNFVYAHGSMSEGIYRRSGSNSSVGRLLGEFQRDAWAAQVSRTDYTEHDVASVLKRFFRDLPEPLLTAQLHKVLCNAAGLDCGEEQKVCMYRSQLELLPAVNYVTCRRLMAHLHHVSGQCERNLMPTDNLAAVWGPTLMHVQPQCGADANWSKRECQVVADLIALYPRLFDVGQAEAARERRMQRVLERFHRATVSSTSLVDNKPSGDLKVWVHIGSSDSQHTVGVTCSPQRTALDVCQELCGHMRVMAHQLCLLESALGGGALIRPLHHTERVLDTVLRWAYWDEADHTRNCLVLALNTIVTDISTMRNPPLVQCGELRYADPKAKAFKTYLFEFSQAKLSYYKDKMASVKLGEWRIEDIVWYIGHEPKRNPHARWSITFIMKDNRSKRCRERPWFGHTLAGSSREQQLQWMAAFMSGQHPGQLTPQPADLLLTTTTTD